MKIRKKMFKFCFVAFLVFNQCFADILPDSVSRRVLTDEQIATLTGYTKACEEENPNGDQNCQVSCLFQKMDIIKNGKFNPDAILSSNTGLLPVYQQGTKEYAQAKTVLLKCKARIFAKKYESCDLGQAISDCILTEVAATGLN